MEPIELWTPARPQTESNAEVHYRAARARLLAAQQEKMEAADEFLAARAALRGSLKVPQPTAIRVREYGPSDTPAAWAGT